MLPIILHQTDDLCSYKYKVGKSPSKKFINILTTVLVFTLYKRESCTFLFKIGNLSRHIHTYRNNKIIHSINPPFIKLVLLCLNLSDGEV